MENTKIIQAQKTFKKFCQIIESRKWNYRKDENKLTIEAGIRWKDLPISLRLIFDADRMMVRLYSPMNFELPPEHLAELALAICIINDNSVNGNFDLDVENGDISYRMYISFRETLISEEAFDAFIGFAVRVIYEHNNRLLMVSNGTLTPQQVLEQIKNH